MEKKNAFYGWLLLGLMVWMVACSGGGEEGTDPEPEPTPSQPSITLDESASDFTVEGGSHVVTFKTSAAWTAEVINSRADGWCSVSPTGGNAGDARITIRTTANDTPDDRSASVVIKAGSTQKTITVSQKQKDALTVTSGKFEVEAEGGEVKIEVKANVDFEYTIDEKAKDWITASGSRALKTSTLSFQVASNEEIEKREGSITISSGSLKETVTIYQSGTKPTITLTQNEYVVSSAGETIAVEVKSNVDVAVELPADAGWISEDQSRAISTNTYYFKVEASEEYEQRSAEIKFTNKANGLSESVEIIQSQKDALVIAKNSYTVSNAGDEITIEVGHNIDFGIEIGADWITRKESASRAYVTDELVFTVAKNDGHDNRESTIKFTSKDGSISQTVKVYQAQTNALVVSQKDIVVDEDGGRVEIEIQSNVNFTVSGPGVSWIHESADSRSLTKHTLIYTVDANDTYNAREAQITIKDESGTLSETVTITQAQKDAIVLAKNSYTVSNAGDEITIEVGHNIDFDIEIGADWIIRKESASRAYVTDELVFIVAKNDGHDNRESTITFTSKDKSITQTVKVYQAQTNALVVSQKDIVVDEDGGRVEIEIQSNVNFTVSGPGVSWIHESADSRSLTKHTLVYTVDANDTYNAREAQITIKDESGTLSEVVTITQAQKDAIVLAKNSYTVSNAGDEITIEVGHNIDFDIEIGADWITRKESASRAYVTDELVFIVAKNDGHDNRESTIKFTSKDGSVSQTVKVYQAQTNALVVSQKDIVVDEDGGRVEIEIQSNVNFTVSGPGVSWIHESADSRSLTKHTLVYTIDANDTYNAREAQITIKDESGTLSEVVTITQVQKDAIVLAKDSYTVGSEGGQLHIEVGHNIDFDISIDVDWITQNVSRSYGTSVLMFNVAENTDSNSREGIITFASKDGTITQKVKITQKKYSSFDSSIDDWEEDEGNYGGSAE